MDYILNIDTSLESARICLGLNGELIAGETNPAQQDHAAWLQPTLQGLLKDAGVTVKDLKAVAVVAGPGSYTGLRVGLASAKGLCYALNIPLICMDGLELMARSFYSGYTGGDSVGGNTSIENSAPTLLPPKTDLLVCPMVDARRMEVFTALYNSSIEALLKPQALILEADSFDQWIKKHAICFIGNGAKKYKDMLKSANALFIEWQVKMEDIVAQSAQMFSHHAFADLAYSEPLYIKDFYLPGKAKT